MAKVDENRRPIPGTEMEFDVDTILLLSLRHILKLISRFYK